MERLILKTKNAPNPKKKLPLRDGDEARKKFERTMKALFQVPKADSKKPKKGKD
jgi:hypothetical protein